MFSTYTKRNWQILTFLAARLENQISLCKDVYHTSALSGSQAFAWQDTIQLLTFREVIRKPRHCLYTRLLESINRSFTIRSYMGNLSDDAACSMSVDIPVLSTTYKVISSWHFKQWPSDARLNSCAPGVRTSGRGVVDGLNNKNSCLSGA